MISKIERLFAMLQYERSPKCTLNKMLFSICILIGRQILFFMNVATNLATTLRGKMHFPSS